MAKTKTMEVPVLGMHGNIPGMTTTVVVEEAPDGTQENLVAVGPTIKTSNADWTGDLG